MSESVVNKVYNIGIDPNTIITYNNFKFLED